MNVVGQPPQSAVAASAAPGDAENSLEEPLAPLDPQITSIQPGGGACMRIELAWGHLRRAYLKIFRRGYLRRMAELRQGEYNACPHEVLDPRDLKYYQNQGGYWWRREDDPFRWRDRLPFARWGLGELLLLAGGFAALTALALYVFPYVAIVPALLCLEMLWFFRDPYRKVPTEPGLLVSPADGKVVEIEELEHDEFIGGPAVSIGIFLSVFNVHINRAPSQSRVIGLKYQPGKFLNALRPESARENERMCVYLQEPAPSYRKMEVRQITGAIARRIVCAAAPGDRLARGERFGMIKLGSRTELVIPREDGLQIQTKIGDRVKAGATILARYTAPASSVEPAAAPGEKDSHNNGSPSAQ